MPSFFQDLNGAFGIADAFDGGGGDDGGGGGGGITRAEQHRVMAQLSRFVPIMWSGVEGYEAAKIPLTIFGSTTWVNVSVSATVALLDTPVTGDPYVNSHPLSRQPARATCARRVKQCESPCATSEEAILLSFFCTA
jgi:hypothetical protein